MTDFSEATKDNVGIGSVVELKEGSTGKTRRYSILGAWDSDPDNDILSYKTPLAQQLLGKAQGDTVTTRIGGSEESWTLLSIARYLDVN